MRLDDEGWFSFGVVRKRDTTKNFYVVEGSDRDTLDENRGCSWS